MGNHADYSNYSEGTHEETLQSALDSYEAVSQGITNWVANLANCSSLVWHAYHSLGIRTNWVGFYVVDPECSSQLILGPFQGKVACQHIKFGRGVCGAAAESQKTQLVPDVEAFPGHIACDGETRSEIVVPLVQDGVLRGVLDLDCLDEGGFTQVDVAYLEKLAKMVVDTCRWD